MPNFTAEEIESIRRCFIFYVKLPRQRWKDINTTAFTAEIVLHSLQFFTWKDFETFVTSMPGIVLQCQKDNETLKL